MKKLILISLFVSMLTVGMTSAQIIKFDENGRGTWDGQPLDYGIGDPGVDPVPSPTLFYYLPFNVVQGDLQIIEPDNGTVSDVLRFVNDPAINASRVFVYSDQETSSFDKDLADTGIPQPWINVFTVTEVGLEGGINGVIWNPTPNQPGGTVAGTAPITYQFISDVPEPATLLLLGLGGLLLRKRSA